jgi:N-acetyl sugar amidotransferase
MIVQNQHESLEPSQQRAIRRILQQWGELVQEEMVYMKYCSRCLQPDTRPNSKFVNDLCPVCTFHVHDFETTWNERLELTHKVIDQHKNKTQNYDAILGVSGGKDSIKLALWARDYFDLRILLVTVSYPPEQATKRGTNNMSQLANLGFDVLSVQPSPIVWKELMKVGFKKHGNWAKSTEMALFSGVPQIAIAQKIPLILWGENPGAQLGDLATMSADGWDGNKLRNLNTLSGGIDDLLEETNFKKDDVRPYIYPTEQEFKNNNIQIIYLGWAMNNWGLFENGLFSSFVNLEGREDGPSNTQDLLGITSLDEDWVTLNQMIKFYKYGFGRATDYVNEWIRANRLSRMEGAQLVELYDGVCSERYIESFCEYLEITKHEFWETVNRFTNKKLFSIRENDRPEKLFKVGVGIL